MDSKNIEIWKFAFVANTSVALAISTVTEKYWMMLIIQNKCFIFRRTIYCLKFRIGSEIEI